MRRRLKVGFVLAAVLVATGALAQTTDLLKPNLVSVGGRRMNLQCLGRGEPAVVFDQGWGGTILDWAKIAGPVRDFTRACFYDRAGEGRSDPSDHPATVRNITDDLHALLRAGGVRGPVVLVGHSLGGLYASAYADRFPGEVAGLVLVDPAFAGQNDDPASKALNAAINQRQRKELATCADLARQGHLSRAEPHDCFSSNPPYSPEEIAYLLPAFVKPFRWEALASELGRTDEEFAFTRSWGDMPVTVLTRDRFPATPGESEGARAKGEARWRSGHDELAARSTRGRSIIVANSGHYIQQDQPQAVVDAIRQVVDATKR